MFDEITLHNRLGQGVRLQVKKVSYASRLCIFVYTLKQSVSSIVAKNAEFFASQLLNYFELQPGQFDLIELRRRDTEMEWLRWRFRWVGLTAFDARSRKVVSIAQQASLLRLSGLAGADLKQKFIPRRASGGRYCRYRDDNAFILQSRGRQI